MWSTKRFLDADLRKPVYVTSLEDFLRTVPMQALREAVHFGGPLGENSFVCGPIDTEGQFLALLRLNPATRFSYVRILTRNEIGPESPHDPSRSGPPLGSSYVETAIGQSLEAIEVLAAYADEPDWGMDQDLFSIADYRYGPCPFGPSSGKSSQAPFHMAFLHAHPMITRFVPGISKTFLDQRVRLFFNLSSLAFSSEHNYWGWRFLAWAVHYLQDVTAPYHASPFPVPILPLVTRFLRRPRIRGFLEANKSYLMNRHFVFEALVHMLLNTIFKSGKSHPFSEALIDEGRYPETRLRQTMENSTRVVVGLARSIDAMTRMVVKDMPLDEPCFAFGEGFEYQLDDQFRSAEASRPALVQNFINLVAACLAEAGKVTRWGIAQVVGKP
jgi:hypothetical protein